MPTINQIASDASLFVLNGKEYSKGNYVVYYNNVITDSSGNIIEDEIQIGLKYKRGNEELQDATHWSNWIDGGTSLPFASRVALLTYLAPILTSPVSTTPSGTQDVNIVSPATLNVQEINPDDGIPDIINYFSNPNDPDRPIRETIEPDGNKTYTYIDDDSGVPGGDIAGLQPWHSQNIGIIQADLENLLADFNAYKGADQESEVQNEFFLTTNNTDNNIQTKLDTLLGFEVDIIKAQMIFLGTNGTYNGVDMTDGEVVIIEQVTNNKLVLDKAIVVPTIAGVDPRSRIGVLINVTYKV